MDWAAVWRDIVGGLLVAGAFAAWVPESWLRHLFLIDHAVLAKVWRPLIGPAVAVVSFVCSVTWLDIAFLVLGVVLVGRFVRSGSLPMLGEMGGAPADANRGASPS